MSDDGSDEQRKIYEDAADAYDELISAEDADGMIARTLDGLATFDGATVADVGAGTARLSRLLTEASAHVDLVDRARPMLELGGRRLEALGRRNFALHEADVRELPLRDDHYDVVMAGWVFGHFRHWMPDGWREEVTRAIAEMKRVAKPGALVAVLETLGTGHEEPRHHEPLEEYFAVLDASGFARQWIRTDYVFVDVETAARVTGKFFGEAFTERVRAQEWARVPECTAVFTLRA